MAIQDRLVEVRNGSSRKDFAAKIGLHPQTLYVYEKGKRRVPRDTLEKICSALNVSVEWLIHGIGQMRPDAPPPHAGIDLIPIPMVDAVLSAGHGSFETSADSERKYAFRSDFLRSKGNISAMVLMRVDGDSMEPRICSGDVVLIDQSQTALRPGQIYAVGVEDMVFLKVVSAVPGKVLLRSLNDAYPPLEVDTRGDLQDSVRIVGRCVWSCREL